MHFDWTTLALQAVNVLILCWLLHRFLYRPILAVMDSRRQLVEGQLAEAATAQGHARDELAEVTAQRSGMASERDAVMASAAAQAEAVTKARIAEADTQAAAIIAEARKAAQTERVQALAEAKTVTLDLAMTLTARLLAQAPAEVRAAAWLGLVERHLAAMSEDERAALAGSLGAETPLRVTTAEALDDAAAWRERLGRALGADLPVTFAVDAGLVGGAQLSFPGAILRFAWKDALDALRMELEQHDDAR
jgi:F-type H+-transporting ATPase subunit b